jgi:hypothetical protein
MNTASIAEWVLSRFTTPERAASIVGDLVESTGRRGTVWFWFSVMRTAFSLFGQRPSANRSELMAYGVSWATYFLTSFLITGKWRHALRSATGFILAMAVVRPLMNSWLNRRRKRLQQRPRL